MTHPLTNFEVQKYYQNEPKYKGVDLGKNLPKTKEWAYVVNLDECNSIGTHWIALYVNGDNITYLDSFRVEHIPKKIQKK